MSVETLDIKAVSVETLDIRAVSVETLDIRAVSVETLDIRTVSVETLDIRKVSVETLDIRAVSVETPITQIEPKARVGLDRETTDGICRTTLLLPAGSSELLSAIHGQRV